MSITKSRPTETQYGWQAVSRFRLNTIIRPL